MSSATACAAITSHNTSGGSISNLANCSISDVVVPASHGQEGRASLAEKFHGLTEKFTSLGRSDSESCNRNRTGTVSNIYNTSILVCIFRQYTIKCYHAKMQWNLLATYTNEIYFSCYYT